eukprot:TRINITY_DN1115_c0_g1_i1.p1 TRINITY_DN1115_c0_g1~~TRINITY_DN1115_c0_g1_i1.p1  ORF type:complete len:205 (-),score=25.47 TRINITY_DN1115_c0_g1_i1:161-775(-)
MATATAAATSSAAGTPAMVEHRSRRPSKLRRGPTMRMQTATRSPPGIALLCSNGFVTLVLAAVLHWTRETPALMKDDVHLCRRQQLVLLSFVGYFLYEFFLIFSIMKCGYNNTMRRWYSDVVGFVIMAIWGFGLKTAWMTSGRCDNLMSNCLVAVLAYFPTALFILHPCVLKGQMHIYFSAQLWTTRAVPTKSQEPTTGALGFP